MKLEQLAGNEALKRQLSAQAKGRGLSHAYLISGPAGSGKRTLSRLLAAAMVCTGEGEAPCGICPGCKKALGGIHPDIMVLGEEDKEITVGQARTVRSDAYIRPNEAPRKIYLIQNAQNMNPNAQNALLKLLEEGPPYAAFLLLTDNPGALLTTVRSRCEGLPLSPVTAAEAEAWLARRFPHRSPEERHAAALGCGGLLGEAVALLEGDGADGRREAASALLTALARGDELGLMEQAVGLEKWERDKLAALFEELIALLRDALALRAGSAPLCPPSCREAVEAVGTALTPGQMLQCVKQLEELRRATTYNVGAGHLCGALAAGLARVRG